MKIIKYANMQEIKSVDDGKQIIEFIASKEIPDYDNDIVKIDGIDISKINKNKSFLWSHQQSNLPVGKIIKLWKEGNVLKGKAQLTSEDEHPSGVGNAPNGATVYRLMKSGYINNISISFLPDYDSIEYKKNKKTGKTIQIIHKSTLLEISAVNIGCNTGTSIQVKSFNKAFDDGIINDEELENLTKSFDEKTKDMDYDKEIKQLKEEIDQLKDKDYLFKIFNDFKKEESEKVINDLLDEYLIEKENIFQEAIDDLKA